MKFCPNCGNELKKRFNVCPSCGTNLKEQKEIQINVQQPKAKKSNGCLTSIVIILLIFGMIGYLASKYDTSSDETKYDTAKTYSIGEKLICPKFEVTVDKVQIKKKGARIDDYSVVSDPEWIGVTLTVKNTSDETKTFYTSKVKLTNSNGEIIDPSWLTYNVWGVPSLNSPELAAGGTKTGYIDYTNNNDNNSNLLLTIDCTDGLFDQTVKYKVNISQ